MKLRVYIVYGLASIVLIISMLFLYRYTWGFDHYRNHKACISEMGIKTSRLTVPPSILCFKLDGYHNTFAIKRSSITEYDTLLNNIQVGDTVLLTHDYIPQLGNGMNDQVVHLQKGQMVIIDIMDRRHRDLYIALSMFFVSIVMSIYAYLLNQKITRKLQHIGAEFEGLGSYTF